MKKISCFLLILLLWLANGSAWAQTYTIGIVPQQSASQLAKLWVPILEELEKELGFKLQFSTAKDIPTFEQRVFEGYYDFSYMNPYHYVVFSQKPGYRAFAREKDKLIQGILVVQEDSPIKNIEDLKQQQLAFPSPAAFAASVLPRASLTKQGIPFTPKYVKSHDSVYRSVAKGIFPAGGGIKRTFNSMPEDIRSELKVFWTTYGFTPHAFATHPRIPEEHVQQLQQAMIGLINKPQGASLLSGLNFKKGLRPAVDSDWDDVRSLNITLLDKYLK